MTENYPPAPAPTPAPESQPNLPGAASSARPEGSYPPYGREYGYGDAYGPEAGLFGHITLGWLWRLLRRQKALILSATAFGLVTAYYLVRNTTVETYRATSVIEMSLRKPRILDQKGAVADEGYASSQEAFETRLDRFTSPAMRVVVVEKLREIRKNETRSDPQLSDVLAGGVAIAVRGGTRLVNMSFRDTDAKFAADAANAYAAAAEASVFEENKATSEKAVAWLQAQAVAQRKLLADTETALAEFRAKNHMDVLDGRKKSVEQSIASLSAAGASLEGEIVMRNQVNEFLTAMKVQPDNAEALPNNLPRGDVIAKAVADRRAAVAACNDLAKRYTPEHPDFKAAKARVDAVHAQLLDEIRAALTGISTDLELLRKQSDALQKRVAEERTNLAELERQTVALEAQLTAMQRERDAMDITYRGILTRIEEARLSADENTAIVRVVESAEVPTTPMKRAAGPLLLFGCLLGLAAGLALALASEAIDDRVTSFADVELGIGVKVLGLIPRVPKAKRAELAMASLSHDYGAIGEAFAGIRSLLNSARYRDSSRAILIASFAPMEGKTIVSCNLAIGIAKRGEKTLLVDFDLRRPRLSGIFARPEPCQSLLHVLADGDPSKFDGLPMPTECENLHVISSRASTDINPAEVMGGKTVETFLQWASKRYERVIVDSPPFGIVSDASVLATLIGSLILVCRPERTRKRNTRHGVRHFAEMGVNVIGAIVNDIDLSRGNEFSNEYYQYPYSYRQGYEYYRRSGSKRRNGSGGRKSSENGGKPPGEAGEKEPEAPE